MTHDRWQSGAKESEADPKQEELNTVKHHSPQYDNPNSLWQSRSQSNRMSQSCYAHVTVMEL